MTKRVLIGMPAFNGQVYATTVGLLMRLYAEKLPGISFDFFPLTGESLLPRARDTLAHVVRKHDYTHLLFLDADVFCPAPVLGKLFEHEADVTVAHYPRKTIDWEAVHVASRFIDDGTFPGCHPKQLGQFASPVIGDAEPGHDLADIVKGQKPFPWRYGGTGCMLITKDILNRVADAHPELRYNSDRAEFEMIPFGEEISGMFQLAIVEESELGMGEMTPGRVSRRLLSEDYSFCYRVRNLGGTIMMHPGVKMKHVGTHIFDTCISRLTIEGVRQHEGENPEGDRLVAGDQGRKTVNFESGATASN